jgi:hypothetical protein
MSGSLSFDSRMTELLLLAVRQLFPPHLLINVANGNMSLKQLTLYSNNS